MKTVGALKIRAQGEREIVMTREFDAPRQLVFDAWTKPELLRRWLLGPEGWSMPICEIDLRPGGELLFTFGESERCRGIVEAVEPMRRFAYWWQPGSGAGGPAAWAGRA